MSKNNKKGVVIALTGLMLLPIGANFIKSIENGEVKALRWNMQEVFGWSSSLGSYISTPAGGKYCLTQAPHTSGNVTLMGPLDKLLGQGLFDLDSNYEDQKKLTMYLYDGANLDASQRDKFLGYKIGIWNMDSVDMKPCVDEGCFVTSGLETINKVDPPGTDTILFPMYYPSTHSTQSKGVSGWLDNEYEGKVEQVNYTQDGPNASIEETDSYVYCDWDTDKSACTFDVSIERGTFAQGGYRIESDNEAGVDCDWINGYESNTATIGCTVDKIFPQDKVDSIQLIPSRDVTEEELLKSIQSSIMVNKNGAQPVSDGGGNVDGIFTYGGITLNTKLYTVDVDIDKQSEYQQNVTDGQKFEIYLDNAPYYYDTMEIGEEDVLMLDGGSGNGNTPFETRSNNLYGDHTSKIACLSCDDNNSIISNLLPRTRKSSLGIMQHKFTTGNGTATFRLYDPLLEPGVPYSVHFEDGTEVTQVITNDEGFIDVTVDKAGKYTYTRLAEKIVTPVEVNEVQHDEIYFLPVTESPENPETPETGDNEIEVPDGEIEIDLHKTEELNKTDDLNKPNDFFVSEQNSITEEISGEEMPQTTTVPAQVPQKNELQEEVTVEPQAPLLEVEDLIEKVEAETPDEPNTNVLDENGCGQYVVSDVLYGNNRLEEVVFDEENPIIPELVEVDKHLVDPEVPEGTELVQACHLSLTSKGSGVRYYKEVGQSNEEAKMINVDNAGGITIGDPFDITLSSDAQVTQNIKEFKRNESSEPEYIELMPGTYYLSYMMNYSNEEIIEKVDDGTTYVINGNPGETITVQGNGYSQDYNVGELGYITVEGLQPNTEYSYHSNRVENTRMQYIIKEVGATNAYEYTGQVTQLDAPHWTGGIDENGKPIDKYTVAHTEIVDEERQAGLTLTKVDDDDPENLWNGAKFEVYDVTFTVEGNGILSDDKYVPDTETKDREILVFKGETGKRYLNVTETDQFGHDLLMPNTSITIATAIDENGQLDRDAIVGEYVSDKNGMIDLDEIGLEAGVYYYAKTDDFKQDLDYSSTRENRNIVRFNCVTPEETDGKLIIERLKVGHTYKVVELGVPEDTRFINLTENTGKIVKNESGVQEWQKQQSQSHYFTLVDSQNSAVAYADKFAKHNIDNRIETYTEGKFKNKNGFVITVPQSEMYQENSKSYDGTLDNVVVSGNEVFNLHDLTDTSYYTNLTTDLFPGQIDQRNYISNTTIVIPDEEILDRKDAPNDIGFSDSAMVEVRWSNKRLVDLHLNKIHSVENPTPVDGALYSFETTEHLAHLVENEGRTLWYGRTGMFNINELANTEYEISKTKDFEKIIATVMTDNTGFGCVELNEGEYYYRIKDDVLNKTREETKVQNGSIFISDFDWGTVLKVSELEAPDGYEINENYRVQRVVLTPENNELMEVHTLIPENSNYDKPFVHKTVSSDDLATIDDAEFKVYNLTPCIENKLHDDSELTREEAQAMCEVLYNDKTVKFEDSNVYLGEQRSGFVTINDFKIDDITKEVVPNSGVTYQFCVNDGINKPFEKGVFEYTTDENGQIQFKPEYEAIVDEKTQEIVGYKPIEYLYRIKGNVNYKDFNASVGVMDLGNIEMGSVLQLCEIDAPEGYESYGCKTFVPSKEKPNWGYPENREPMFPIEPNIGTQALVKDIQLVLADEQVDITDIVSYSLLPYGDDVKYVLKGTLMNKETEQPLLDGNGQPITSIVEFIPQSANGKIEVLFDDVDLSKYRGESLVVFEELYRVDNETQLPEEEPYLEHENINDEKQTLYVPLVGTIANINGSDTIKPGGKYTIVDKVDVSNILPEMNYELKGTLIDKATGKPVQVKTKDGEFVDLTITTPFVADETNETIEMTFEFDAPDNKNHDYVVFEEIYVVYDKEIVNEETGEKELVQVKELVGEHKDINDEGQTVHIREDVPPEEPNEEEPPKKEEPPMYRLYRFVKTGTGMMLVGASIVIILSGAGLLFIRLHKRKKTKVVNNDTKKFKK